MKPDDFEKQLRRQPMRSVPSEWRKEILRAAVEAANSPASASRRVPQGESKSPFGSWWRELLWPCPQAWAGLAAVWMLILAVNFAATETPKLARRMPTQLSPEMFQLLQEQKRLYAELLSPAALPPAEPPKTFVPRPRSERRTAFITV